MIKNINILENKILSDNWYILKKITYEMELENGKKKVHSREAYDRGNGAVIMLYNREMSTVVLTRQFRLPTFINGNSSGMMIEACAGLLDQDHPEDCIRRETEEETGYRIGTVSKVFEAYMSPGSVTEILYFFIAEYDRTMKVSEGGGLEEEQEDIEVLELDYEQALKMIGSGDIKDAKTIMLLQYLRINGIM